MMYKKIFRFPDTCPENGKSFYSRCKTLRVAVDYQPGFWVSDSFLSISPDGMGQ